MIFNENPEWIAVNGCLGIVRGDNYRNNVHLKQGNKMDNIPYIGYYINLKDSIDRDLAMTEQLKKNNMLNLYSRFEAIEVKQEQWKNHFVYKNELGCLQSHLQILKDNFHATKHIHILEDDVILHKDHHNAICNILPNMPKDWDILYTGSTFGYQKEKNVFFKKKHQDYSLNKNIQMFNMQHFECDGAYSYIINKNSIAKVYDKISKKQQPIDVLYKDASHLGQINSFCLFPTIARHNYELESTIRSDTDQPIIVNNFYQQVFYQQTNFETLYKQSQEYIQSRGILEKPNFNDLLDYFFWAMVFAKGASRAIII